MDGAQLTSWFDSAKGEVPLPLTGPSLNLSPLPAPHPPTVFLFGGKLVVQRRLTAEMWAFDINSRTWSRVNAGNGPGSRYFHSMDVWKDKLVCFGGMADNDPHSEKLNVHNDVWMFDCRTRRWLPQPSPEAPLGSFASDDETLHPSPPGSPGMAPVQDTELLPTPRYAHLSAISRGKLMVCGGQRMDNSWIYEMNVYDLERNFWVSKTDQPVSHGLHSKGAYRSVTASSPFRVIVPPGDSHTITGAPALSYTVDEDGSGGDIWCYSNYDFAKVRRELEILSPLDGKEETPTVSDKYASPPGFIMKDLTNKVNGSSQPPGLRFPTGGIIGNHFVLCGLYLASTSAAFSIWTLDLTNHTWKHIEPPVLASGSWNIVVPDPTAARLLIFGNAQSDLASDYSKRAVSLNHVAVIELEAFGVYQAPRLLLSEKTQDMGLSMLDEKLVSDFDIVCEDGRRIKCSRKVLSERWPWFAEQLASLVGKAGDVVQEMPSLDINDALLGSLSPARFTPNRLHLPEPLPVCVALIQFFYTLNLSTPLQNRPPVLCALLFVSKQYKIDRLNKLVVHALHSRLDPGNAIQVYEVAALAGEQNLSARALAMVNPKSGSSSRQHHRRPGSSIPNSDGLNHPAGGLPSASSGGGSSSSPNPTEPTTSSGSAPGAAPTDSQKVNLRAFRNSVAFRAREDSLTCPVDVLSGCIIEEDDGRDFNDNMAAMQLLDALAMKSPPPLRAAPAAADEYDSEEENAAALQLLDALDITAPPPLRLAPPPARRPTPVPVVDEEYDSEGEDVAAMQLFDALDITSPPPLRTALSRVPPPLTIPISRSTSRCSTSTHSSASSRARRLPPLMPPPERPLPFRPESFTSTDDHRSYRSYSPTNSDVTSICPRTPSDSIRNSRDSTFLRDSSPTTPSLYERRPSLSGTPTKLGLPALLEDELMYESEEQSGLGLMPPLLQVVASSAPLEADLGNQQERALEAMQNGAPKLVRATSLNSMRQRSSLDVQQHSRTRNVSMHCRRDVESMHGTSNKLAEAILAPSPPPPRPEVHQLDDNESLEDYDSEDPAPTRKGRIFQPPSMLIMPPDLLPKRTRNLSGGLRPSSMFVTTKQPMSSPPARHSEEEEQERLTKFQAFIAEQQRGVGLSTSEAYDHARRATGKAGSGRGKLGRLGAKFADVLSR